MGLFALSTLLVTGAGIYILSKVFPNFQPGNKKVQADLKTMKVELAELSGKLVPFASKDLELLAGEDEDRKVKKRFTTQVKGKLSTIFSEPVASYAYKHYLSSSGKDAVLYVHTARHDYFYWIKAKGTKVVIDDLLIGTLQSNGVLIGGKKSREIARINRQEKEYQPILVDNKEVANLVRDDGEDKKKGLTTRAFGFVVDSLSKKEEVILLAMAFHELIITRHVV